MPRSSRSYYRDERAGAPGHAFNAWEGTNPSQPWITPEIRPLQLRSLPEIEILSNVQVRRKGYRRNLRDAAQCL